MHNTDKTTEGFKPSDYLRARRPERYSDSIVSEEPQITADLLEYHLDTLTNRSQEKEFEHFTRRLAERELCPNLLPQTGPTGGGDSKVDSETYPVAESIALRWYQGEAGAKERWAFAISAKKDWRGKVRSDVKKISETDRGYTLIYFITNQFVPDKKRAELEDKFSQEFCIPLRILDRTWIVDRIINHDGIELAAQNLSIESLQLKPHRQLGPRDVQRETDLTELDNDIKNSDRYTGLDYQLAEDCLRSAILASELERDRQEVDGRFAAALRVAEKVDDKRQLLRIVYQQAWITCFVYDDVAELSRLYDKVEALALASDNADDIEKLHNLFNVLVGSIGLGQIDEDKTRIYERAKALKEKLEKLSKEDSRPNNAHKARTMLCLDKFVMLRLSGDEVSSVDEIFVELNAIFEDARGLGQYPFASYKQLIFELGEMFPENDAFENLFQTLVSITEERTSEGEAGSALMHRGIQKLRAGRLYDAITLFGRAQDKLVKDEYQYKLIKTLIACGGAYKAAGLLWAARANLLSALSIALHEFEGTGVMNNLALIACKDFVWIEMCLGRVPHILFSIALAKFVASHLPLDEQEEEDYLDFTRDVDAIFSMLLLRLNFDQLRVSANISYVLGQMNLVCAEGSMLFAIGQIQKLREGGWFEQEVSEQDIEKFFEMLCSQPANDDLPEKVEMGLLDTTQLTSKVLGCDLIVDVETTPLSILIAESLLGALESFLATSLTRGILPYKQVAKVRVREGNEVNDKFGIAVRGGPEGFEVEVVHKKDFVLDSLAAMKNFKEVIQEFIALVIPRIAVSDNIDNYLKRLVDEENIFGRSLTFSDVMTVSHNLFGNLEWVRFSEWSKSVDKGLYALERTVQWKPKKVKKVERAPRPLKRGEGEPPEEIKNPKNLKHGDRKVLSVIDVPKWDEAEWSGSCFMIYPEGQFPPCLGLLFKNENAARSIFRGWLNDIGKEDTNEAIRVCIITGIDKHNAAHYRVHIGANLNAYVSHSEQGQLITVSRINTMTPDGSRNLDMFLNAYERYGVYCLMPAILGENPNEPKIVSDLFVIKRELEVKPAWKIGANDDDLMALKSDDQPIIPDGIKEPPVLKALERKRKR